MTPSTILAGVNAVRAGVNLPPVTESATLDAFATWKAQDMCNQNYWAHNSPTSTWEAQLQAYPVYYLSAGENLAYGFSNSSSVVTGWVNSHEHYVNMVNPLYDQAGIGIVTCANYQGQTNQVIVANEFTQTHVAVPAQIVAPTTPPSPSAPVATLPAPAATIAPAPAKVTQTVSTLHAAPTPQHSSSAGLSVLPWLIIAAWIVASIGIIKKNREVR